HGRHVVQPGEESRPLLIEGALRFDGQGSFLEWRGADFAPLEDFTLFIVAAPFSNSGGFRGFLALSEEDQNDFTSGLTVDLGYGLTWRLDTINVEGDGFVGMADLMTDASDFGVVRR